MSLWITSDWHLFHRNIIEYCKRPFQSVEDMNDQILQRHNSNVKPGDTVWHLGDVTFYGSKSNPERQFDWRKYLQGFNGEHHLVLGNHDRSKQLKGVFRTIQKEKLLVIDGVPLYLTHFPRYDYPMRAFQLHGHRHATTEIFRERHRMLDVGVDGHGFCPWHISEILPMAKAYPNETYT